MQKKHIHLLIGILIIVLSLYFAFRGVSISELKHALVSVRLVYLLPAIMLVAISYLLRAMRWHYLIRSVKEVKTSNLFSPLMVGFMGNMLPARAGEFIRAYLLSRKERISFSASFATIFIERLFDLTLVLMLLVSVLIFMPDAFAGDAAVGKYDITGKVMIFGQISFLLCLFIFLFSALLQFKSEWAMKIVDLFTRPLPHTWREKIFRMVTSFSDGLHIIRDKTGFLATLLLSLLIWATFVLTYYPLYFAFDINGQLPILTSTVVLCLTVAIFITVAPTPGFLGSYHLGCVAALHGIFGIQKAVALSYGIVSWLVVMGFTVAVGAVYAIKENISFSQLAESKEQPEKSA
jgi:uncharacterized protein (TIRG00374 family)